MPNRRHLTQQEADRFRHQMSSTILHADVDAATAVTAITRLSRRLKAWNVLTAATKSRTKYKSSRGYGTDFVIPADRAELLIVRAISRTDGACQFTISTDGEAYATEGDGWTIHEERIPVTGLSPLVDTATDLLRRIYGPQGGRMHFTTDDQFIKAGSGLVILTVVEADVPKTGRLTTRSAADLLSFR